MANKLFITEYVRQARDNHGDPIAAGEEPSLATQVIDFTAGVTEQAADLNTKTRYVRLHADTACSFKFREQGGTAAGIGDSRLAANQTEYFAVLESVVLSGAGARFSAIANP